MKYVMIIFIMLSSIFITSCDDPMGATNNLNQQMFSDMLKYKYETGSCMTKEQALAVSKIYNYKYVSPVKTSNQLDFITMFTITCNKGK